MKLSEESFPVTIIKKGPQYYGIIKELSLLEHGENLSEVYEKVHSRKMELLQKFKESNLEPFSKNEEPKPQNSRFSISLNFVIFCFILMIPVLSILHPLSALLLRSKDALENIISLASPEFIVKTSQKIQNMPKEKKQELKDAFHTIATEVQPFVNEFSLLNSSKIADQKNE